jgi:hypothetical protein
MTTENFLSPKMAKYFGQGLWVRPCWHALGPKEKLPSPVHDDRKFSKSGNGKKIFDSNGLLEQSDSNNSNAYSYYHTRYCRFFIKLLTLLLVIFETKIFIARC